MRKIKKPRLMTTAEYIRWHKSIKLGDRVGLLLSGQRLDKKPKIIRTVAAYYKDSYEVLYNGLYYDFGDIHSVKEIYKECRRYKEVYFTSAIAYSLGYLHCKFLIVPARGLLT